MLKRHVLKIKWREVFQIKFKKKNKVYQIRGQLTLINFHFNKFDFVLIFIPLPNGLRLRIKIDRKLLFSH